MSTTSQLLVDTNVLIDYQRSDLSVLTLASIHIGIVYILIDVLQEFREKAVLSDRECEQHGLRFFHCQHRELCVQARDFV